MPRRDAEFYVGYVRKSPPGIAARSRAGVAIALTAGVALALVLVSGQSRFDTGVFEFGVEKTFDGIVVERPYPLLLVPGDGGFVTHYLVAFGKRGANDLVAGMDSAAVRVTGSSIYNDHERMIEAREIEPLTGTRAESLRRLHRTDERQLGTMTLVGEIVDAKCHLGVMKPGRGKPHKACAIRCISGGVPPLLRVEDRGGRIEYFLLVSADGRPVNRDVLDMVAEPLEITGEVGRSGDLLVLYADPSTYRRAGS
jgi:hypothetical protein